MYTNSLLTFDELPESIKVATENLTVLYLKDKDTLHNIYNTPGTVLIFLEGFSLSHNLQLLETLDTKRRDNSVSIFLGYGTDSRLLQEDNNVEEEAEDEQKAKVYATATGALLISLMTGLLAAFGLIMMARIQTPQTFAKRNLIKGTINK